MQVGKKAGRLYRNSDVSRESITKRFVDLGLSEEEAQALKDLYLSGEAKAGDLAKASGLSRINVYRVLERLQKENIVEATMGYDQIRELCKAVEELFEKFRKGEEKISSDMASYLFKCFDAIQQMVDDENVKIDIEQYLKDLSNPSEMGKPGAEAQAQQHSTVPQTIRVKMQDLDSLVDLVGELLIAKMRLEQTVGNSTSDLKVHHTLMSIGRLVSDLQYQTMKLRLVPVEQIFNRFPRMIRDLAAGQGKDIKLQMEGLGIELDRTVLDAITEPLLHMLRNAVDHAQEMPDDREQAGKRRTGTIKLNASKVGDRVMIMVEDDGRGIDIDRLKAKAVEKKLVTKAEADSMTEEQVLGLLGTPGLSTARQVTDISGRGVGLDVVFSQIEAVGGGGGKSR